MLLIVVLQTDPEKSEKIITWQYENVTPTTLLTFLFTHSDSFFHFNAQNTSKCSAPLNGLLPLCSFGIILFKKELRTNCY